jgi:hypothetical protein
MPRPEAAPAPTVCEKCKTGTPVIEHRIRPTIRNGLRIERAYWCAACGDPPNKIPADAGEPEPGVTIESISAAIEDARNIADLKGVLRKIVRHLGR